MIRAIPKIQMDRICGIKVLQIFGAQVFMISTPSKREKARAKATTSVTIAKERDTLHVSARHLGAPEKRGQEPSVKYVAGKGIQEGSVPVREEVSTRKRERARIQDSGEERTRHGEERKEKEKAGNQEKARGCMR